MFSVGDQVICINDSRPEGWSAEHYPQWVKKDEKYTIREILDNDNIVVGILLEELRNEEVHIALIDRVQEGAFATWRFSKTRSAYEIEEEKNYNSKTVEASDYKLSKVIND